MAISRETVEHVAHLARIELEPKELDKLSRQLQDVLDFMENLNRVNVDQVPPTSHILPISNALREDEPRPCLTPEQALSNAPSREGKFFVVPKVIE